MARTQQRPAPPRVSAPDLPAHLEGGDPQRGADLLRVRMPGLEGDVDLEHANLEESVVPSPACGTLALRGATLLDVELTDVRAVAITARDTTIRRVRITGGRIGTLDLSDARIAELELRDVRIDYLSLAGAEAEDVLIAGCGIRSLDVPQAALTRVAFADSRADELDPRDMRARDVDLRGLDVRSCLNALALRGATISEEQALLLAPALAAAAGIDVR